MHKQHNLKTRIINNYAWTDNYMIQSKKWTFKLPNQNKPHNQFQFPFQIYPAYDYSFLIRGLYQAKVKHVLHDGTLLKQRNFEGGNIYMMTDKKVAIWYYYDLIQWDLETNQLIIVNYQNMLNGQKSVCPQAFAFSQSKLFCVVEKTQNGDKMNITYFQFPLTNEKDKPVYQHVFDLKLSPVYSLYKINNHSGLVWRNDYMDMNSPEFHFFTFDLKSTQKIEQHKFNHRIKLKQSYKIQVFDVWQLSEQKIYMKMKVKADNKLVNKYQQANFIQKGKIKTQLLMEEKHYQFIWNMKDKSYHTPKYLYPSLKLLQSTLKLNKEYHIQFINTLRPVKILQLDLDYNRFDQKTMFYGMWKHQYPHYRMKNIYFVDPQTEQIVAVEQFCLQHPSVMGFQFLSFYPSKFGCYFSDVNSNLYYEYQLKCKNNQVQFLIKQLRVNSLVYNEQIYIAFLLLGLFQGNCEEDLISYVIDLILHKEITEQQ